MSASRLTLALPIDVFYSHFDSTVTQTQLSNNVVLGSADDRDAVASLIEDAEGELRELTDARFQEGRAGTAGDRETYPQVTYQVSGHADYKRQWTGVGGLYDPEEVTRSLPDQRILPFDSTAGDEAYIYRGLKGATSGANTWEDVTDDVGNTWDIIDHRNGILVFHPIELIKTMRRSSHGLAINPSRLSELRFAMSYRFGTLGGSRSYGGATTLGTGLTDTDTGSTAVADGTRLPDVGGRGGSIILLIGEEYVRATVDGSGDTIDILERGLRGTTAASHSSGDRVQYTPPSVRKAVAARAAMSLIQSGRYQSFLPDSEDAIDKTDMIDEARRVWDGTLEAMQ